jgi:hypothetical protein
MESLPSGLGQQDAGPQSLGPLSEQIFARFQLESVLHSDSAGTALQLQIRQREAESLQRSGHSLAVTVVNSGHEGYCVCC